MLRPTRLHRVGSSRVAIDNSNRIVFTSVINSMRNSQALQSFKGGIFFPPRKPFGVFLYLASLNDGGSPLDPARWPHCKHGGDAENSHGGTEKTSTARQATAKGDWKNLERKTVLCFHVQLLHVTGTNADNGQGTTPAESHVLEFSNVNPQIAATFL